MLPGDDGDAVSKKLRPGKFELGGRWFLGPAPEEKSRRFPTAAGRFRTRLSAQKIVKARDPCFWLAHGLSVAMFNWLRKHCFKFFI